MHSVPSSESQHGQRGSWAEQSCRAGVRALPSCSCFAQMCSSNPNLVGNISSMVLSSILRAAMKSLALKEQSAGAKQEIGALQWSRAVRRKTKRICVGCTS